jgi:hypothetical protein
VSPSPRVVNEMLRGCILKSELALDSLRIETSVLRVLTLTLRLLRHFAHSGQRGQLLRASHPRVLEISVTTSRYHRQWQPSPINKPWLLLGLFSIEDSQQISFYRARLLASRPTPNLEEQVTVFITPETGFPSYNPGHCVARVHRDRHFPYPLTCAPEGISKYLKNIIDSYIVYARISFQ